MIGISIADIIGLFVKFYDNAFTLNWFDSFAEAFRNDQPACLKLGYVGTDIFHVLERFVLNSTRPISIWLAILMALIRALSIIFPMSNRVQNMTKPKWTLLMMLLVCVFWTAYYSWELRSLEYMWLPKKRTRFCALPKNLEKNAVRVLVITTSGWNLDKARMNLEYVIRIVPAFLYPILTIPLIIELWKVKKRRKIVKPDNTIFLIFFMTLSFMLSEGLEGVFDAFGYDTYESLREGSIFGLHYGELFGNLRTLNALSHFFVCVSMSSQYRNTVTGIFPCCKSKNERNAVQQALSVSGGTNLS